MQSFTWFCRNIIDELWSSLLWLFIIIIIYYYNSPLITLQGKAVTAVAWNPESTLRSTGAILIGTRKGWSTKNFTLNIAYFWVWLPTFTASHFENFVWKCVPRVRQYCISCQSAIIIYQTRVFIHSMLFIYDLLLFQARFMRPVWMRVKIQSLGLLVLHRSNISSR